MRIDDLRFLLQVEGIFVALILALLSLVGIVLFVV